MKLKSYFNNKISFKKLRWQDQDERNEIIEQFMIALEKDPSISKPILSKLAEKRKSFKIRKQTLPSLYIGQCDIPMGENLIAESPDFSPERLYKTLQ